MFKHNDPNIYQVKPEDRPTAEDLINHAWLGTEFSEAIQARKAEEAREISQIAQEEEELRLALEVSANDT